MEPASYPPVYEPVLSPVYELVLWHNEYQALGLCPGQPNKYIVKQDLRLSYTTVIILTIKKRKETISFSAAKAAFNCLPNFANIVDSERQTLSHSLSTKF